jgi:hypothetical protein
MISVWQTVFFLGLNNGLLIFPVDAWLQNVSVDVSDEQYLPARERRHYGNSVGTPERQAPD